MLLKGVDIDPEWAWRFQTEDAALEPQDTVGLLIGQQRAERPPGNMQRLVEVVRAGVGIEFRPEQIDELFAEDALTMGKRDDLDETACLRQSPAVVGYLVRPASDAETAEQFDAQ